MIRSATPVDGDALAAIYNPYILKSVITFEEERVTAADMAQRVDEVRSASLPWLVALAPGGVVAYAYASKWKGRCAYRHSAEVSVYVDEAHTRQGLGRRLYQALLDDLRQKNFHVAIGGIALPNAASVKLHEDFGFEKAAHFAEVGYKFGRWIDVGYWQLMLQGR